MKNDTKQNYWFKRRRYGYGWTPVTRRGWLAIIGFLAVVLGSVFTIKEAAWDEFTSEAFVCIVLFALSVAVLVYISYKKGPMPKWRWGSKTTDTPEDDF